MTIDQGIAVVMTWLKRIAGAALMVFIILTLMKLLGFNAYPVQSVGFQELGVFLAGSAFALSKL